MSEISRSMNTSNNQKGNTPTALTPQQRKPLKNQMSTQKEEKGDARYLSKIDMDFMVAKLTGLNWIKSFNKQANIYDSKVNSPKLGFVSHLHKNDSSLGAKGKIEFEHFLKLLEIISEKLYPELELEQSLQIIIENHILKV